MAVAAAAALVGTSPWAGGRPAPMPDVYPYPGSPELNAEVLSAALDAVQIWAVVLTLGFTLVIFFFLAFCVCTKKDDR